jgi:anti-anti-sigma factor
MSGAAGLAEVTVRVDRSVPICAVRGEIDASNVESVLEQLVASAPNDSPGLVLDLAETVYLDSAGVRILFELARRMRTRRQELRVAVPPSGSCGACRAHRALRDRAAARRRRLGRRRLSAGAPERPASAGFDAKWSVRPVISSRRTTGSLVPGAETAVAFEATVRGEDGRSPEESRTMSRQVEHDRRDPCVGQLRDLFLDRRRGVCVELTLMVMTPRAPSRSVCSTRS